VVDVLTLRAKKESESAKAETNEREEGTNLDTKLLHRLRSEQSPDLGGDGAVKTADDNLVSLMQDSVRQNDINRRSETLDDLDLKHRALEGGEVHETLDHTLLGELDDEHEHVGHSLSGVGRGGNERDDATEVLVLVVGERIESLLGEGDDGVLQTLLILALNGGVLGGERVLETAVGDGLPAVETIDL
jgi:hypothetical protein